ncbi:hypothetical protein AKO1_002198 [Acrasis kona]|uniref:Lama2 n=1 Tax=Acrasis kona TaxID=1008807 RepID=A0AAW2YIB6_9EUKA
MSDVEEQLSINNQNSYHSTTSSFTEKDFPALGVSTTKKKRPANKRVKSYSSGLSVSPADGSAKSNGVGRNWQQEFEAQKEITENLKTDLKNLNDKYAEQNEELEKYQRKNELLGEELTKKEDAISKVSTQEDEKNDLLNTIKDLKSKLTKAQDDLKDKDKKMRSVNSLLEGQQADTRAKEDEIVRLTASESKLKSDLKKHHDADNAKKQLEAKVHELEASNSKLQKQVVDVKHQLEVANKNSHKDLEALRTENSKVKGDLISTREELKQSHGNVVTLRKNLDGNDNLMKKKQKQYEDAVKERDAALKKVETLNADANQLKSRITSLESELDESKKLSVTKFFNKNNEALNVGLVTALALHARKN